MQKTLGVIAALVVAACAGPASVKENPVSVAQAASTEPLRVCSWNMRRLGHDFDQRPKDIDVAADIVDSHCDVVAVQEVMQKSGGVTPGFTALLDSLGSNWSGVITTQPRPNSTSSNSEFYAFYFRTSEVVLCPNWTRPHFLTDDADAFLREPAWICLSIAGRSRELLLADYHAIYGSVVERRREVTLLDDDLDADGEDNDVVREIRASRPNAADVILVGDFNLTPRELSTALPGFIDLAKGSGSTLNLHDEVTSNLFDHALVTKDEAESLGATEATVLDVRSYAQGDTFYRSVSDHLPIRFELSRTSPP